MADPKVSIIIPNLNYGRYLREAVESALNQTVKCEVIVVDGGSTDGSSIIETQYHPNSIRMIHYVKSPVKGVAASLRNEGIRQSSTEWIVCLDADDKLSPTYVEECLAAVKLDTGIVSTGVQCFGDSSKSWNPTSPVTWQDMLSQNRIFCASMFRKEAWEAVGGYTEEHLFEDWDLWLRIMLEGWKVRVVPKPLFHWRDHSTGTTNRMTLQEKNSIRNRIFYKYTGKHPKYRSPGIEGWMTDQELQWLYETAREMSSVVEIGSWKGRSTHALASGCKGIVTAIDHFQGPKGYTRLEHEARGDSVYEEFKRNLARLDNVQVIRQESLQAARNVSMIADMVFIDGEHTENAVREDVRAWLPKAGKMICGHDYSSHFPGVCKAVDQELGTTERCGTIWYKRLDKENKEVTEKTEIVKQDGYTIYMPDATGKYVVNEVIVKDNYRLKTLAKYYTPKTIMDVGGNFGCFGLAAKMLWPDARIVAYEPNPTTARIYRENIEENRLSNSVVVEKAVNYDPDKMWLAEHIGAATGGGILTSPSELPNLPGKRAVSNYLVASTTLERILNEDPALSVEGVFGYGIDLLKLDCEGSELGILCNMSDRSAKKVGLIVGEYHYPIGPDPGKFSDFSALVKSKFPWFEVISLGGPNRRIGEFMAGPPDIISKVREDTQDKSAVTTPAGNTLTLTFIDGCKVEVIGPTKADYVARFDNLTTGENVYTGRVTNENPSVSYFMSPAPQYYVKWRVTVEENGREILQRDLNLAGQKVLIRLTSKALGDTIAWIPYAEEFRKAHDCEVSVETFWPQLFDGQYPEISIHPYGSTNERDFFASYHVGCWDDNYNRNPVNWRVIPLQQVAADGLGLPPTEIRPKVRKSDSGPEIDGKYVTISEFSTFHAKAWLYPHGWQEIVDWLTGQGYKVVSISKEPTGLRNVIQRNARSIQETIRHIQHAEFHIGVSSGPVWLAWGLGVPVVLISGFTDPYCEFTEGCYRVTPADGVCHGCIHDLSHVFDRGQWKWCPRSKRHECSAKITPKMVQDAVHKLMGNRIYAPSASEASDWKDHTLITENPLPTRVYQEGFELVKDRESPPHPTTIDSIDIGIEVETGTENLPAGKLHYSLTKDKEVLLEGNFDVRKTKVLYVTPHLSTGGLPQYLLRCVEELTKIGTYDITVVEWRDYGPDYVVQKNRLKELCTVLTANGKEDVLLGVLKSFRPDILHFCEFPEYFLPKDTTDLLYIKFTDDKPFGTVKLPSDYKVVETSHWSGLDFSKKWYWPSMFVAVTTGHAQAVYDLEYESSLVGYQLPPHRTEERSRFLHGCDSHLLACSSSGYATDHSGLGLDLDKIHVLNVGLFTPNKNQGAIFDAARRMPWATFHFVGNQAPNFKSYWKPLMANKPDNCVVWGERSDVGRFYRAMDLLLFPSLAELRPIVPIEAMYWGMPVLMKKLPIYDNWWEGKVEWLEEGPDADAIYGAVTRRFLPMGWGLDKVYRKVLGH